MLGRKLKKPPIVGLVASISILIILLAYTFVSCPLDNLVGIVTWLCVDIITFAIIYITVSLDVCWLDIFSTQSFQKNISIMIIAIMLIIVGELILTYLDMIAHYEPITIYLIVIMCACFYIISYATRAQKELKQGAVTH